MQLYIRQHVDCKSENVIYPVTCNKCKVQCVGSTFDEFKIRFRNHKLAMSTKKTTCEVACAIYFNKEKHQLSDFEFMAIEQICNSAFSHDVMAAILVFQNNETVAMLVYQENPPGV